VRSMPRPCQVLALLLPVLYAASLFFPVRARPFIALVPAYTMGPHYYLWTILLSGFYEYSLASLLLSVAVILTAGVKLCQAWTSKVFVGYLLAVNAVCSVACLCWSLAAYAASLDVQLLYDTFWCGFGGGAAAIAVALHAVKPNSYVLELPFLHVRTQQLPLFIFLYHMLGYGVRVEAHSFAYTAVGAYCSWLYLRFLRRSFTKDPNALPLHRAGSPPSRSVSIGDPRPDMSLAAFFPAPLQFLVARLGALCSTLLKPVCGSLRYAGVIGVPPEPFTPAAWTVNRQSNSSSPTGAPSAGGSASSVTLSPDVHDAARRRERARKALDQRLAQAGVTRSSLGSSGSITDSSTAATMTNNSGGGGGGSSSSSSSSTGDGSLFLLLLLRLLTSCIVPSDGQETPDLDSCIVTTGGETSFVRMEVYRQNREPIVRDPEWFRNTHREAIFRWMAECVV